MITLIQRVKNASVTIEGNKVADISQGILALVCFESADTEAVIDRQLTRLLNYRIFSDAAGKMNLSVKDIEGSVLLVPQFTLGADTNTGNRPSFSTVAPPALGEQWFHYAVERAKNIYDRVQTGVFGADMAVGLINDGPVTFWLQSHQK